MWWLKVSSRNIVAYWGERERALWLYLPPGCQRYGPRDIYKEEQAGVHESAAGLYHSYKWLLKRLLRCDHDLKLIVVEHRS
jgi:hypothetical protein